MGFFYKKKSLYFTQKHQHLISIVGVAASSSELFAASAASAVASPPEPASASVVASASVHAAQASVLPGGCRA
jgi:hypothetical protein